MIAELLLVIALSAIAVVCNVHAARLADRTHPRHRQREAEWEQMIARAFDRRG